MTEIFDTCKIWTQVFLVGEPGNLHCKEIAKCQHSEYWLNAQMSDINGDCSGSMKGKGEVTVNSKRQRRLQEEL